MDKPNYYAVIPAEVRYDEKLKDKAKLIFGELVALSDKMGYCYATNKYFADLYKVSTTTVSTLIKNLIDRGYVESEIVYRGGTKEILNRYLKIVKHPIKENLKENNTSNNTIKEIDNNKLLSTKKNFQKPTFEDVKAYCKERNNCVDPQLFIDFYESNGWKVGKNSMKDWKACVRTWEKNTKVQNTVSNKYQSNYEKGQEILRRVREEYEQERSY